MSLDHTDGDSKTGSAKETEQVTLTVEQQTALVNQRNTDEYDVDIGRANGGQSHLNNTPVGDCGWLGNPYKLTDGHSREKSIKMYRKDFYNHIREDKDFREAVERLKGLTLACWCRPRDCHGDVIVDYLDGEH